MNKVIQNVILVLVLIVGLTNCSEKKQETNGILILYSKNYDEETKYEIYNKDFSLYARIESINGNEPSCKKLEGKIWAYYDDYYIFHFESIFEKKDETYYHVIIGDSVELIKKSPSIEILTLESYILMYYCSATIENPIRPIPSEESDPLPIDFGNSSFKCKEIKGDWVNVECNLDCEGCMDGELISGWIRWRKNNKIILKQVFVC